MTRHRARPSRLGAVSSVAATVAVLLLGAPAPLTEPDPPRVVTRPHTHPCPPGFALWFADGGRSVCIVPTPEESP